MPFNPLRQLREDGGYSQAAFARKYRVNVSAVQLAEAGCYSKPLTFYAPYLSTKDYSLYQKFRVETRKSYFPEPPPVLPLASLLEELGLSTHTLGIRLCVQPAVLYRLLRNDRIKVPQEIITAFKGVGWSDADIKVFARNHLLLAATTDV